jgi:hypothetical protein
VTFQQTDGEFLLKRIFFAQNFSKLNNIFPFGQNDTLDGFFCVAEKTVCFYGLQKKKLTVKTATNCHT